MNTLITGETWGDEIDSVRAHLLRDAELPFSELGRTLAAAETEFRGQLQGCSDAQAQFVPPGGEGEDAWGIAEVARHLASAQSIMAKRVHLLATGQSLEGLPRTQPGYLDDVASRHVGELLGALDESYVDLLKAIDGTDGGERLDTHAAHRRFGELNCHGWVALHTLHLRDHARQIARLKGMDGFPRR